MTNSSRDHFTQNVLPACTAFFEARDQNRFGEKQLVRLGTTAASALFHLREHVPEALRPSKEELAERCPEYDLIADVANASKHAALTRGSPRLRHIDQVSEVLIQTKYADDEGEYTSAQAEVWLTLDDGTVLTLASQINSVLEMWASILRTLGVGDFSIPRASSIDRHIPRAEAKPMPIEVLQGEERRLRFQLREFDYSAGVPRPVDLTGATLEFNVYKPPDSATIHIKAGTSIVDFSVPLTREQAIAFAALPDDRERAAYLEAIITADAALRRQIDAAVQGARDGSTP